MFHTAKLQLNDFKVPDLPEGYRLVGVDVLNADRADKRREKDFHGDVGAIDSAVEYALLYLGWESCHISLILHAEGMPEKRMIYTPRTDNWDEETDVAEDESVLDPRD